MYMRMISPANAYIKEQDIPWIANRCDEQHAALEL